MGRRPQTTLTLVGETRTLSEDEAAGRRLQGADATELKGMTPDSLIIGTKTAADRAGTESYFEPMRKPSVRHCANALRRLQAIRDPPLAAPPLVGARDRTAEHAVAP